MKNGRLYKIMSEIDEEFIDEAAPETEARTLVLPKKKVSFGKIAAIAACFVLICSSLVCVPLLLRKSAPKLDASLPEFADFVLEGTTLKEYKGDETEELIIPEGIEKIADYAFLSNEKSVTIKQISIPESVKFIENDAFAGCSELARIILDGDNMNFVDNYGVIMNEDKTCIYKYEREGTTSYKIPSTVKFICAHAFQMSGLEEVTFPEGLEYIGYNAFAGCPLKSIYLPDSLLEIADGAFSSCHMAIDGHVPEQTIRYDGTFEYVPFYMTMVAGHTVPVEEILRGNVTIEEAFDKSDRSVIMEQVTNIIDYLSGARQETFWGWASVLEGKPMPTGVVLPDVLNYDDFTVAPGDWSSNVACSLLIPCEGDYDLSIGFSLYAPWDYYEWNEVKWRAEETDFVSRDPALTASGELGDWYIEYTVEEEQGSSLNWKEITFTSKDGKTTIREFRFPSDTPYKLSLSPDGNAVIVEYTQGNFCNFFVEDLTGRLYESWWSYKAPCVPYFEKGDTKYVAGSATWNTDPETMDEYPVAAENVMGKFLMNYKLDGQILRPGAAIGGEDMYVYYDLVYIETK